MENAPPRRGLPVWAWVLIGCGCAPLLVMPILAAILFPVFAQARERARQTVCMSNLKQISMANLMYAQDHNGLLPPKKDWHTQLVPYLSKAPGAVPLVCPSRSWQSGGAGYAMNGVRAGTNIDKMPSPAAVPLIFETDDPSENPTGDPATRVYRHIKYSVMAYADGHVRADKSP